MYAAPTERPKESGDTTPCRFKIGIMILQYLSRVSWLFSFVDRRPVALLRAFPPEEEETEPIDTGLGIPSLPKVTMYHSIVTIPNGSTVSVSSPSALVFDPRKHTLLAKT